MKINKNYLKQIIKEEINKITEGDVIDAASRFSSSKTPSIQQSGEEQIINFQVKSLLKTLQELQKKVSQLKNSKGDQRQEIIKFIVRTSDELSKKTFDLEDEEKTKVLNKFYDLFGEIKNFNRQNFPETLYNSKNYIPARTSQILNYNTGNMAKYLLYLGGVEEKGVSKIDGSEKDWLRAYHDKYYIPSKVTFATRAHRDEAHRDEPYGDR